LGVSVGRPEVVFGELPDLERAVSAEFLTRSAEAISKRGRFVFALPGGSVATELFPALAKLDLDWTRVDVFWIDERAVPPDHPDSNFALASRLLLQPAGVPASGVHRMRGELADLDEAARLASDELTSVSGDPPHLDLALVGIGEDGHVASIFNGVGTPSPPIIAVYESPKPPARRLTMTLPVIAGAGRVVLAAFGRVKAQLIQDELDRVAPETPAGELLRQASSAIVLIDRRPLALR
jgi:6-phosphogluconolactonase